MDSTNKECLCFHVRVFSQIFGDGSLDVELFAIQNMWFCFKALLCVI